MSAVTLVLAAAGIALLVWGADLLVRGASHLAEMVGIPPLVVGLTVVALGTSAPEFAVSLRAALAGEGDLTLGNVIGSNIANVLLILGLAAVTAPLLVAPRVLQREVPTMIAASLLLWLLAADGAFSTLDGALLVALLLVFLVTTVVAGRRDPAANEPATPRPERTASNILRNLGLVVGGLILLVAGAQWLVDGATAVARAFGVSELIIGLTVLAVGTSLPEIATSVLASLRGEREIAVGNVVGSNVINILGVMGLTALISPKLLTVPASALAFDIPVMVAAAFACLPIFFNGRMIARWEGGLFLAYYGFYTTFLVLAATGNPNLRFFTAAMLLFVIPLTVITLGVLTAWNMHRERTAR